MDSVPVLENIPKMEINPHEFDWYYPEEHSERILDLPPLDCYFELDPLPFPHGNKQLYITELKNFEDLNPDFVSAELDLPFFYEDVVVDQSPLNSVTDSIGQFENLATYLSGYSTIIHQGDYQSSNKTEKEKRATSGRKKMAVLELDEIQKHFDIPITKAAKKMNVGLTVLKKRCRELNIKRWPHRKLKSLTSLINNVKELGLTNEVETLEEHKKILEKLPDAELTERTRKLRQACFKANYKKRRSLAIQA
ncbi:hypothetical protein I3760_06G044400 [Carya illinoinensis]|uniref:RWP-RK domain-containing protein n=1 Tax=Carya illinoinensis TaxID=32201 RepID=A0A8T1Q7W1_CARIL|nr:protein RKD4 [Carya illinoinensis]KAG2701430.1 hypothetical protein I3760_06G044400 [Carya illinoinensis]KAG6650465.1 hypothetical protein CIPAW_06G045400 [Carya illinoinensis]